MARRITIQNADAFKKQLILEKLFAAIILLSVVPEQVNNDVKKIRRKIVRSTKQIIITAVIE